MAEVSSTMSMLHSLMPALEATGLLPPIAATSTPAIEAPRGLTPAELSSLPTCCGVDRPRFPDEEESEEDGCPICLNDIAPDEEVLIMPCAHSFHTKCVTDWLKRKTTCPCCNHDVGATLREAKRREEAEEDERALDY